MPNDPIVRSKFIAQREIINSQGIDEFSLFFRENHLLPLLREYDKIRVNTSPEDVLLVKYENFIDQPLLHVKDILNFISCTPSQLQRALRFTGMESFSSGAINPNSHKRDGRFGQFKDHLNMTTIDKISNMLHDCHHLYFL